MFFLKKCTNITSEKPKLLKGIKLFSFSVQKFKQIKSLMRHFDKIKKSVKLINKIFFGKNI